MLILGFIFCAKIPKIPREELRFLNLKRNPCYAGSFTFAISPHLYVPSIASKGEGPSRTSQWFCYLVSRDAHPFIH